MEKLEVRIGADIRDLKKKLPEALKKIDDLKTAADKLKKSFKDGEISSNKYYKSLAKNNKNLRAAKDNLNSMTKAVEMGGKNFNSLNKNVGNATPTLQEFSRIIQDAPYGIIGVGNNITQLVSNFGNLKRSTGSTGKALKSLLSSFTGSGGILFAVSAATTLWTLYEQGVLSSTNSIKKLSKAMATYLGDAIAEKENLSVLISIAKDEAQTKSARLGAINELNQNYSDYLGNLDLESVKTDKVAESVNKLTNSLILQAKIKGVEDLISETASENAEKLNSATLNLNKRIKERNELLSENPELKTPRRKIAARATGIRGNFERNESSIDRLRQKIKELNKETEKTLKPLLDLQKAYKIENYNLDQPLKEAAEAAEKAKEKEKELADERVKASAKAAKKRLAIEKKLQQDRAKELAKFNEYAKKIEAEYFQESLRLDKSVLDLSGIEIIEPKFQEGLSEKIEAEYDKIIQKQKFTQEKTKIISDAISSSIGAMGNNIANELKTGSAGFDAFTASVISNLSQLIAQMITTALTQKAVASTQIATNKAVAVSEAIKGGTQSGSGTGPAAIFTTPAFIATLIGVVGGAFAAIGGFANGGYSGDNNLAFLNKNELVLRPFEQSMLLNALKGSGMSKISNNTSFSGDSLGGLTAKTYLRGTTQTLQIERSKKRMRKFYNS